MRKRLGGSHASPATWRDLWVGQGGAFLFLLVACAKPPVVMAPPVFVGYEETGQASWYGQPYHGRRAASGEVYDMSQMTAAHRTLPFGTWVVVENRLNGQTAEVRITDRGPFTGSRILDLSQAAARVLGAVEPGVIPVRLHVIGLPDSAPRAQSGTFSVQVASFTSEYRATVLKDILARTWADTYIQRAEIGGRMFYRVRVGKYATRPEAHRLAQRLAAAGYEVIMIGE
jgi:rare lipoprotein A